MRAAARSLRDTALSAPSLGRVLVEVFMCGMVRPIQQSKMMLAHKCQLVAQSECLCLVIAGNQEGGHAELSGNQHSSNISVNGEE